MCYYGPFVHKCVSLKKTSKNNALPFVLHFVNYLCLLMYALWIYLCIPAFVFGARGVAPQHVEHSKIAFHNFAATGSIFNALMMSHPAMGVGVLVRSISGS